MAINTHRHVIDTLRISLEIRPFLCCLFNNLDFFSDLFDNKKSNSLNMTKC